MQGVDLEKELGIELGVGHDEDDEVEEDKADGEHC